MGGRIRDSYQPAMGEPLSGSDLSARRGWPRRARRSLRMGSATTGRPGVGLIGVLMMPFGGAAIFAGLVALVGGLSSSPEGPPTCGGQVMRRDDTCIVSVNSQSSSGDYEEMERREETALRDGLVIGGTGLGAGTVLLLGGWGLKRWSEPGYV
jgi:hypothetical protein